MATLGVNFFNNRLYFAMEEGETEAVEAVIDVDVDEAAVSARSSTATREGIESGHLVMPAPQPHMANLDPDDCRKRRTRTRNRRLGQWLWLRL